MRKRAETEGKECWKRKNRMMWGTTLPHPKSAQNKAKDGILRSLTSKRNKKRAPLLLQDTALDMMSEICNSRHHGKRNLDEKKKRICGAYFLAGGRAGQARPSVETG